MRSFGIVTIALFLLAAMFVVFGGDDRSERSRDLHDPWDWVPPPPPTTALPWWSRSPSSRAAADGEIAIPEVPFRDFPSRGIPLWRRPMSVLQWYGLRGAVFGRLSRAGPLEFDEVRRGLTPADVEVSTYRAWLPASAAPESPPESASARTVDLARFVDATQSFEGVFLRVDHRRPWRDVEDLLAAIVEGRRLGQEIEFDVDGRDACCDLGLSLRVKSTNEVDAFSTPRAEESKLYAEPLVRVRIDRVGPADAGGKAGPPRVRIGSESWTFPAGDPYSTPESVESANRTWNAVAAALAGALTRGRPRDAWGWYDEPVGLEVDPEVPWSHVAQFAGIASRAHAPHLRIQSRGFDFWVTPKDGVAQTEDVRPDCDPRRFFDPPGVDAWVELGAGALAAVAFVVGLARTGRARRASARADSVPGADDLRRS